MKMALRNASEALQNINESIQREKARTEGAVKELAACLGLNRLPNRIEAFDISNIQGTDSVASMVVFEGGKPKNSDYRRFRIKGVRGPNDIASMAEVIERRFRRGLEEKKRLMDQGKSADDGMF